MTMTLTRLESGAWHLRFGPYRFVQWVGAEPQPADFFGDWSEAERRAAIRFAHEHPLRSPAVPAEDSPAAGTTSDNLSPAVSNGVGPSRGDSGLVAPPVGEGERPRRIQRKRTKGWRMPEGAVYVGRPTKWGNPFPLTGSWIAWTLVALGYKANAEGRRAAAIALYRFWLTRQGTPERHGPREWLGAIGYEDGREVETADHVGGLAAFMATHTEGPTVPQRPTLDELRGKDLACWCPLDQPCHADVLLELANSESR